MKINAVTVYPKQQNFKGLFKKVEEVKDETYYEPAYEADLGQKITKTTIYYYPYADEDSYSINRFVSHNTFKRVTPPVSPDSSDQTTSITEGVVKVLKPLSITEREYRDYKEQIETAKRIYEEKLEIARMAAIRALAPKTVFKVEDELINTGLDEWVIK